MPSILYANLGPTKRISEIVFAGSHDASITAGSVYAQTQDLDIAGQADGGVRLFDLRVLARKKDGGTQMVGYHGSPGGAGKMSITSNVTGSDYRLKTNKSITGEFGLPLVGMLQQAKNFVATTGEFLIFKFDKCTNYDLIADYCTSLLGNNIYKPIGKEFGLLTLQDLSGKVVCVFNEKERAKIKTKTEADGILGFKSLKGEKGSVGQYDANYSGLQYYGKGGTNPKKVFQSNKMKMIDNRDMQLKMLRTMAKEEGDYSSVLGMMYWTSTGATSSIRTRNNLMWGATGVRRMNEMWTAGLNESINTRMQLDKVSAHSINGVRYMKTYFPNIIMIDFADPGKCQAIYDLNTAAELRLVAAYDAWTLANT